MGQVSLDTDRVQKLRKSVVRVLINGEPSGTGFFVGKEGQVATCWHVIKPAIAFDTVRKMNVLSRLEIELYDSSRYEYGIIPYYWGDGQKESIVFDYCLLGLLPKKSKPKRFETLPLGNFADINEGEVVYSCGYPLGIQQQFISMGILSTKWEQTIVFANGTTKDTIPRNVAWLDLTMNKGNSGGPVIKLGSKPEEDRVIGIASFIITPYSTQLDSIAHIAEEMRQSGFTFGMSTYQDGKSLSLSQTESFELITKALSANSVGISACTSIDHLRKTISEK